MANELINNCCDAMNVPNYIDSYYQSELFSQHFFYAVNCKYSRMCTAAPKAYIEGIVYIM